ncbi:hypothetical protein [Desulforudis sp. DRI-14]|uniref:hypothetical protein n=1 Tax=Desulforudis sp. DRI-14 TaxID=3459793 RepID=UPI0040414262
MKNVKVPGIERINVFVGNLGSGKTELAINTAMELSGVGKVALVDLDIVNPYYRTRHAKERLERPGLEVVCPSRELIQADIPALPPAILGVLTREDRFGVFDVGGDDIGATVLGRFKPNLPAGRYAVFFVVNACRPRTRTFSQIVEMLDAVQRASRTRVHYLVNNTNLGADTDLEVIVEGQRVIDEVSGELGIPVAFVSVRRDLADRARGLGLSVPVVGIDLYMRPPWEIRVLGN